MPRRPAVWESSPEVDLGEKYRQLSPLSPYGLGEKFQPLPGFEVWIPARFIIS